MSCFFIKVINTCLATMVLPHKNINTTDYTDLLDSKGIFNLLVHQSNLENITHVLNEMET